MGQPEASPSITIACDDCGKRYTVRAEALGRRVKCKACGNPFTAKLAKPRKPASAAKAPAIPRGVEPVPIPNAVPDVPPSHVVAGAFVPDGDAGASQPKLAAVVSVLLHFQANMWVLLACLVYAAVVGIYASSVPQLFNQALMAFPVLAVVFLVVGLLTALLAGTLSPDEFKLRWSRTDSLAIRPSTGSKIGYLLLGPGRDASQRNDQSGLFYHRAVKLMFQALGVASMAAVVFLVAYALDAIPKPQPPALAWWTKVLGR